VVVDAPVLVEQGDANAPGLAGPPPAVFWSGGACGAPGLPVAAAFGAAVFGPVGTGPAAMPPD
jgi:hypothetical protein